MSNKALQLDIDIRGLSKNRKIICDETEIIRNKTEVLKESLIELSSFWQGRAADAFSRDFDESISKLEDLLSVARQLSKDYGFAVNSYIEFEQKASDIINAIKI